MLSDSKTDLVVDHARNTLDAATSGESSRLVVSKERKTITVLEGTTRSIPDRALGNSLDVVP